jgi:glyoxylase-like metal-dependent hydrolase (beta-lactamase superfamily II)
MKTRILMGLICLLLAACAASQRSMSPAVATPPSPGALAPPTAMPSTGPLTPATSAVPAQELRVTVLYDNIAYDSRLKPVWGFAALIEVDGQTLLFDTGNDAPTLLANMKILEIDPSKLQGVIFSHPHADHTGGLNGLLQTGVRPTIYALPSFPDSFKSPS